MCCIYSYDDEMSCDLAVHVRFFSFCGVGVEQWCRVIPLYARQWKIPNHWLDFFLVNVFLFHNPDPMGPNETGTFIGMNSAIVLFTRPLHLCSVLCY